MSIVYAVGFNAPSEVQETALPTFLATPPQNMMAQYQSVNGSSMLLSSQAIQSTRSHAVLEHSINLMKVMKAALKDEVEAPQTPLLGLKDITKIEHQLVKDPNSHT